MIYLLVLFAWLQPGDDILNDLNSGPPSNQPPASASPAEPTPDSEPAAASGAGGDETPEEPAAEDAAPDGAADGVTNVFVLMNAAKANDRLVHVDIDSNNFIVTAYLL